MSVLAKRDPHSEVHRKTRAKNWAVMAALLAFCVLIYLVTLVRLGGN